MHISIGGEWKLLYNQESEMQKMRREYSLY